MVKSTSEFNKNIIKSSFPICCFHSLNILKIFFFSKNIFLAKEIKNKPGNMNKPIKK